MAIAYPLNLPTVTGFSSSEMQPMIVAGMNQSPFTGHQQVYEWSAQWIQFTVTLPPMSAINAGEWMGFFLALHGVVGTFLLGPSVRRTPVGVATGVPLVAGGGQVGNTLVTDGWTAGVTNILKRGDWFQLGTGSSSRLHRVVQDVNSDGGGNATLEIWPALRSSPADNAALTLSSPKGLFRMISQMSEAYDEAKICHGMSFTAIEVIE